MRRLRGSQRGVGARSPIEELEDPARLLPVQPHQRLALEDFLRLPERRLNEELVER